MALSRHAALLRALCPAPVSCSAHHTLSRWRASRARTPAQRTHGTRAARRRPCRVHTRTRRSRGCASSHAPRTRRPQAARARAAAPRRAGAAGRPCWAPAAAAVGARVRAALPAGGAAGGGELRWVGGRGRPEGGRWLPRCPRPVCHARLLRWARGGCRPGEEGPLGGGVAGAGRAPCGGAAKVAPGGSCARFGLFLGFPRLKMPGKKAWRGVNGAQPAPDS
jgi:hypothetical protein